MSQNFVARIRKEGKITIPKEIREYMKIDEGDLVEVSLKKPMWWEMLDWDEMGQEAWDRIPDKMKFVIRKTGNAPKFDVIT